MPWTADPKKRWLEDLHKVLAEERIDPMSDNNDWSVWQESIGRDDAAPSYINIMLSTGRVLRVCQEDLINCIERGQIEATSVTPEDSLVEKYPIDLSRVLSASDCRFLHAVGISLEQ